MGETVVRLAGVGMEYHSDQTYTRAIDRVDGEICDGAFVSLVGPSGCGKSTLLDTIGGIQFPTSGTVEVAGEPVTKPHGDIAMVFQEDSLLPWRTVLDNVTFGLEIAGVNKGERHQRARAIIDLMGLGGFLHHRPRQLSGGMKQRVAVARALVMDPKLLLMDEPFGALDQQTRMFMGAELLRVWQENRKTVVFVTHDIQEAVLLSDQVWIMSSRPSTVIEKFVVDLPRPRSDATIEEEAFQRSVAHVWSILRREGEKGLADSDPR